MRSLISHVANFLAKVSPAASISLDRQPGSSRRESANSKDWSEVVRGDGVTHHTGEADHPSTLGL